MSSLIKAVHSKHVLLNVTNRFYFNCLQKCGNSGAVINSANENFLKYGKSWVMCIVMIIFQFLLN